jgi:hypothetical protein
MRVRVVDVGALSVATNYTAHGVLFVHSDCEWTDRCGSDVTEWLVTRYRRHGYR